MPSDTDTTPGWWSAPNAASDQPIDFSTKGTRIRIYSPQPTQKIPHAFRPPDDHHASSTTPDSDQLRMGFIRPSSPPSAPPQIGIHPAFGLVDSSMLAMNDAFRPGLLGGLSSLPPVSNLDPRRPPAKNIRPFKAYPRDPLSLPLGYCGFGTSLIPMDFPPGYFMNDPTYDEFRRTMLPTTMSSFQPSVLREEKGPRYQQQQHSPEQQSHHHNHHHQQSSSNGEDDCDNSKDENSTTPPPGSESPPSTSSTTGNGGPIKRRPRTLPDELKDEAYWERRRKNNEAAKRSRDARRAKEDEIAIRAAFLEQENLRLKVELNSLRAETTKLKCLLYNS